MRCPLNEEGVVLDVLKNQVSLAWIKQNNTKMADLGVAHPTQHVLLAGSRKKDDGVPCCI